MGSEARPGQSRRSARRAFLAAAGIGGAAALLYGIYPSFWREYLSNLRRPILPPPATPNPTLWPDSGLHAAWLGHSTVLLKIEGFTIITDPIFSDRAGISVGPVTVGVKRLVSTALAPADLPKLDLILLSHAHMDHMDIPSLRHLEEPYTSVITAANTTDLLRPGRYARVHETRWGESIQVGPVTAFPFEVRHWGARLRNDLYRGYNGYLLNCDRFRVIFAGDTGYSDGFKRIRGRRPVDLAIMPIGCYNPYRRNHCSPEEAWRMCRDSGSDRILPIHHGTFQLSREPIGEPLARLLAAVGAASSQRVPILDVGQEFHLDS